MNAQAPALTLRRMATADLDAVHALDQRAFANPWPRSSFEFELNENKASSQWVAEVDRRVVGVIVVWLLVDEAHIATLAVEPELRGRGIAARLLCAALHALAARGATTAALEVRAGNQAALRLYRRFGFVQVGRRKGYYQDNGEDALLLDLTPLDTAALDRLCQDRQPGQAKDAEHPNLSLRQ
ncbi:MAG: ribosomal protein S18-alanine N-acetyltransferase [Chloroflexi bacterium]|nr:ribosomal protein S18-alanine N-acetyltransferase [Chloroflexota bacterium]